MGGYPTLLTWMVSVGLLFVQRGSHALDYDSCQVLQSRKLDIVPEFKAKVLVFQQCCNLCASMEWCAAVNYQVHTRTCELLHTANNGGNLTTSPSYIYGKFQRKLGQSKKNSCRTRPCEANQICVMISAADDHVCFKGGTCSTPPVVSHMTAEMDLETLTTGQAKYSCDEGYLPQGGSSISECTDGTGWSTVTLVCQGINCGHPPPQSNQTVTSVTSTLYLDQVNYSCDVGYNRTEGEGTSVCQEDGTWSVPSLKCQAVDCGTPPDIADMVASSEETIYMSVTNYTCSTGFEPVTGTGVCECHADGVWSRPSLSCTKKDCGHPPPQSNQNVTSVTSTLYLDQVSYSCDVGYNRTEGEGTSVCLEDGTWSVPSLKCQVVTCGALPDWEGMETGGANSAAYGSLVTYSCSPGFESAGGEGLSMCQANGTWGRPSLNCTRKDCQAPTSIDHMTVNVTSTLYESEVVYSCNVGYNVTGGDGRVMCQSDATWEAPSITCEIVDCGSPPETETMTSAQPAGTHYQASAVYSCQEGYTGSGDGTSICQASGTWSTPSLLCHIVDCGHPAFSDAYKVNFNTTSYQSAARLECALGYYPDPTGDIEAVCQGDGSWSPPYPSCRANPFLVGTDVSESNQTSLQCRDVRSPDPVTCDDDEILAGCSSIGTSSLNTFGENITSSASSSGLQCSGIAKLFSVDTVARCCRQRDLQCEYMTTGRCYKNFQILDCTLSCTIQSGYCGQIHANQSCQMPFSTTYAEQKIICCTSPSLSCHVKTLDLQVENESTLTLTCGEGEVMTGCKGLMYGYNTYLHVLGAIIEVINGTDTCVIPMVTHVTYVKGYAHCCRTD
ncbi:C4b-binding protein alpha chain-like [Haliotis asinina]|uniref:C4b-binding protein alpha chain-like n=1 Tax=Haliotis asinina TaxID=109174 RepID=UPI003531FC92